MTADHVVLFVCGCGYEATVTTPILWVRFDWPHECRLAKAKP